MSRRIKLTDRLHAFLNPRAISDDVLEALINGNGSSAGVTVNERSAMRIAAVYACQRVLAETVASLPLELYRRMPDGRSKERATDERLYDLLHTQPNSWQTSFEFREMLQDHVMMRGNGYAFISRSRDGVARELIPMHPDNVVVEQDAAYRLHYKYTPQNPTWNRGPVPLEQAEVFHIRGLTRDGFTGVGIIEYARDVFGGAIAEQQHGNRLWKNGANPGIILQHPKALSDRAYERLQESWDQQRAGVVNSGKTVIAEEGMTVGRVSMTSSDAQFIESRKFSRTEIAGMYRVPPHMIGEMEKSTTWGTGLEQLDLGFIKHSVRPWLVRWEQALHRDVIRRSDLVSEFNVDGLARGDLKSRYDAYALGRNWGFLSVNDIRAKENMNPIENGDEYLTPLNMRTADKLDQVYAGVKNGILPNHHEIRRLVAERLNLDLSEEAFERQVNPNLIQRAFLEDGVIRVDELRMMVGLQPLGGEDGDRLVNIGKARQGGNG